MNRPPLNRPGEAGRDDDARRDEYPARRVGALASDAETERQRLLARDGAKYLLRSSVCICLHCLVMYCDGSESLADFLVSEVGRQVVVQPILIPHTPTQRRYTPYLSGQTRSGAR